MGLSMVNCDSCDGLVFSYCQKRKRYRMESVRSTPYSHSYFLYQRYEWSSRV